MNDFRIDLRGLSQTVCKIIYFEFCLWVNLSTTFWFEAI